MTNTIYRTKAEKGIYSLVKTLPDVFVKYEKATRWTRYGPRSRLIRSLLLKKRK